MNRYKYSVLFFFLLIIFQLIDFFFLRSRLGQINDRFIFGHIGNNSLAIIISLLLIVLLYWIIPKTKSVLFAFSILIAGVISNIVDRVIYGGVVDYVKIWSIPTFNLADIVIVGSIFIIFVEIIKKTHHK